MSRSLGAALCVSVLIAAPLTAQDLQRFAFGRSQMGTQFSVVVLASDSLLAQKGAEAAFARIDTLNGRLSDYLSGSELSRLSGTAGSGKAVSVSDDLWTVLNEAQRVARLTDGRFDPTVGPLTRLWRWAFRRNMLPPAADLEVAHALVGHQFLNLEANDRTVRLAQRGMRLDLGGIAKGFAADEALKVLEANALPHAVVDAGGDIALGAAPPDSAGWTVALEPAGEVFLAGCGIATSGSRYRYIEQGGVRYSHILDPRTGMGVTHERTVAVIAPTAMEADALASAASVMTKGELQSYADSSGARVCNAERGGGESGVDHCIESCRQSSIGIIIW